MRIPDQFAAMLLEALRPRERELLGLYFLQQFSVSEAAHMLRMKPDSVSGHITKGLRGVAKVLDASPDDAREFLDAIGEFTARQHPKQTLSFGSGALKIDVLPHRTLMGAAVRHDEHLFIDSLRYFVAAANGRPFQVADAEQWALKSPVALGSSVVRELLAIKGIKSPEKYDSEITRYFFPAAFGCVELYYEHDFDHKPLTLPLPPGRTIMQHFPPVPADPRRRTEMLPRTWPFRVVDLGEYAQEYDHAMAEDAERALRSRRSRGRRNGAPRASGPRHR